MAFFEDLGKKLTDAGQGVAQQTKNFTEVTKLNSSISDREKKISQLYTTLGQSYYQQFKDDPAAFQPETMGQISQLFAEIADCKEQIKQIKGVSQCPSCGAEVDAGAAFCPSCGAKVLRPEPEAAPGAVVCPNCHATLKAGAMFCNQCGTKLG